MCLSLSAYADCPVESGGSSVFNNVDAAGCQDRVKNLECLDDMMGSITAIINDDVDSSDLISRLSSHCWAFLSCHSC